MEDKKGDRAAQLVSSDKEVNANGFGEGPASEADNREQKNGDYAGCPSVGGIVAPGFRPWEQLELGGGGGGGGGG